MTNTQRLFVLSFVTVLVLFPPPAAAAPRLFDEFVLTSWAEEDGLHGGWVLGLAQDAQGYMWIGTVSGLLRFDGLNFERFNGTETTRLPRRSVSAIYGARDGTVWVGFSGGGGIYQIRGKQIREFGAAEGLGDARTNVFIEDLDGAMLAATPDGLYRLHNNRWQLLDAHSGLGRGNVSALYRDRAGRLWTSGATGIFRRDQRDASFHAVGHPSPASPSLTESPSGVMWTADPSHGYAPVGGLAPASGSARSPRGNGYRLLHDRAGNLWVATLGQGLWYLRDGRGPITIVGAHNGLSSDTVRTLFEDRNGDIWVGTTTGLHRFARRRVQPITDLGVVSSVEADSNGDVWVGTLNGLIRFSGDTSRRYDERDGLPSAAIRGLHRDHEGRLWVSTRTGLATRQLDRFMPVPLTAGAWPVAGPTTIAAGTGGSVWLGVEDHGLFRWQDGQLASVPLGIGGATNAIHSVSTDRAHNIWLMLSGGGLARIDASGQTSLLRHSDKFHRSDLAVHEDESGTLWFGAGDRLTRYRDGRLESITTEHGLPSDAIRAVVSDNEGHLWIGTSAGIIRVAITEVDRVLSGAPGHLDFRSYSSSDGLPAVPVRVGLPNAIRATDGRLWFVTGNGVTVIDPRQLSATRPDPPVRIERVTANGRSFDPAMASTLPPRTTSLQIDYTALEFSSPRHVHFRYRLQGLSDDWIDAGQRRQAVFTNLPPRHYRFDVLARSSEGVWGKAGATMAFAIEPTFYQTGWFAASGGGAAVGGVLLLYRSRRRRMKQQFEMVLNERARMARELHDTLLQSLAGLELQMDVMSGRLDSDAGGVKLQLERVRRQIQSDVSEARQSIFDLRSPTLATRDLGAALQDLGASLADVSGVRFEASITGSGRVSPRVEEHLLRVGREALSNSMRHAQARLVRLELRYTENAVILRVTDDGCGFEVAQEPPAGTRHWGLASMRERAAAIGGRLTLVSQPGAGTNLEIVAPMAPSP